MKAKIEPARFKTFNEIVSMITAMDDYSRNKIYICACRLLAEQYLRWAREEEEKQH